jgi:hypothetical protein
MSIKNPLITFLILVFATVSFAPLAMAEPIEVRVGVSDQGASKIAQILEEHPKACEQEDFYSADWSRTAMEFFLVCRAIRIGGLDVTYSLQSYPNSARTRAELKKGSVMFIVDLPWGNFSDHESLYKSRAVLKVGDFVKGIYTRPDHKALQYVKTIEGLRKFTAVTSRTWFYDWDALERMKVKKIAVPKYVQMGRMVESGRADFLIDEFPRADDLSRYINGVRFIPVPGIKLALLGSRHVAVSKRSPQSKKVFDAIQIGLNVLHEKGLIRKGYLAVGFINPVVEDWKILCCEENQETDPNP